MSSNIANFSNEYMNAFSRAIEVLSNTKLSRNGDEQMQGVLNMNNNRISNLSNPTDDSDASTKLYVDNIASSIFSNTGGDISGQVSITNNSLSTSSSDGSFTTAGGVGIEGNAIIDGVVKINNNTPYNYSNNPPSALHVVGGIRSDNYIGSQGYYVNSQLVISSSRDITCNNLYVQGVQSSVNTTTVLIPDNIITVNASPLASKDSGIIVQRWMDDVINNDVPFVSNTAQGGATSSITLHSSSSNINDFYNGMYIVITNDIPTSIIGSKNIITDYDGTSKVATVSSDWSVIPNSSTIYEIYSKTYSGLLFRELTQDFILSYISNDDNALPTIRESANLVINDLSGANISLTGGLTTNSPSTINKLTIVDTSSTSISTSGGLSMEGLLYVNDDINNTGRIVTTNTTNSTSSSTGSITSNGGLGILLDAYIGGKINIQSTANNSISTLGGLSVAGDTNVSGIMNALNGLSVTGDVTISGSINNNFLKQSSNFSIGSPSLSWWRIAVCTSGNAFVNFISKMTIVMNDINTGYSQYIDLNVSKSRTSISINVSQNTRYATNNDQLMQNIRIVHNNVDVEQDAYIDIQTGSSCDGDIVMHLYNSEQILTSQLSLINNPTTTTDLLSTNYISTSCSLLQDVQIVNNDNIFTLTNNNISANTISCTGINLNNNKIIGLQAGTNPTDAVNLSQLSDFISSSGGAFSSNINMNGNSITGLPVLPLISSEATSLQFVIDYISNYLPISGGFMNGAINMSTFTITNLPDPIQPTDVAIKSYVDDLVASVSLGSLSTDVDINGNKIINMGNGVNPSDGATFGQLTTAINQQLHTDGTNFMLADLDVDTHKIVNLGNPTLSTDATNKSYVDNLVSNDTTKLLKSGGTMTGVIDMGNNKITGLANGTNPTDAVNYSQLSSLSLGAIGSNIDMQGFKLTNMGDGTNNTDAITKQQLTSALNTVGTTYLSLSGGTMTGAGDIDMNFARVINLNDPRDLLIGQYDAATRNYVDLKVESFLPISGGLMHGDIGMQNLYRITGTAEPINAQDVATKNYVDSMTNLPSATVVIPIASANNYSATLTNITPVNGWASSGSSSLNIINISPIVYLSQSSTSLNSYLQYTRSSSSAGLYMISYTYYLNAQSGIIQLTEVSSGTNIGNSQDTWTNLSGGYTMSCVNYFYYNGSGGNNMVLRWTASGTNTNTGGTGYNVNLVNNINIMRVHA